MSTIERGGSRRLLSVAVMSASDMYFQDVSAALADLSTTVHFKTLEDAEAAVKRDHSFDFIFVTHWRARIPSHILKKWKVVGFHTSPLPQGRGGSPIQNQILRGLYRSQVCAFEVVESLDAGPVYCRRDIDLEFGSLEQILRQVSRHIADMAREIVTSDLKPQPQKGTPSFFPRRRPEESELNLQVREGKRLYDQIRMLDGLDYPRAFLQVGEWKLTFEDVHIRGDGVIASVRFDLI